MNFFKGKHIIVTGASTGIGRAIAIELNNRGSVVYACARSESNLRKLTDNCPAIKTKSLDLTDWSAVENWFSEIPKIDCLVNNAGMYIRESPWELSKDITEKTIALNLVAPLHLTQLFSARLIKESKPGCIVNISSISSIRAVKGNMVYGATKAGIDQMTRSSAFELGPYGIRVNAVNPTLVDTPLARQTHTAEEFEHRCSQMPLGSLPSVEDVVNATIFLISDQAKMITGQCLSVDAGVTTK